MNPTVQEHIEEIRHTFLKFGAEKAYLFGSAADGNFHNLSDVDFLFRFPESMDYERYSNNYFALVNALENILKRKVDLVAEKTLSNPYLVEEINRQKIQIV